MSLEASDILQEISNKDLIKLSNLYKERKNEAPHVVSLIDSFTRWKKTVPEDFIKFYSVRGNLKHGTFILLAQFYCYDIFYFTLEESCDELYHGLSETKLIDLSRKNILHTACIPKLKNVIEKVLESKGITCKFDETRMRLIDKETALNFEINIPDDVYIKRLREEDAVKISSIWPHKFPGADKYLGMYIKMNGGYGVYLKSDDTLVSWIIRSFFGQMGMLQTVDNYKKNGYGALMIKTLSKEIAKDGYDPLGTVIRKNVASEKLFDKLGFRNICSCFYIFF